MSSRERIAGGFRMRGAHGPRPDSEADRLRQIIDAQRTIACASADVDALTQVVADTGRRLLAASAAAVGLVEGNALVTRARSGAFAPAVGTPVPLEGTLIGIAVRDREPQLCIDSYNDPRTDAQMNRAAQTRSSVIVPLVHEGCCVGTLTVTSPEPGAFGPDDVSLLSMIGDVASARLAFAFARAELRDRQHRLALSQRLAGLAAWEWDASTGEIEWSSELLRMLGFDAPVSFEDFLDRLHADDREMLLAAIQKAFDDADGFSVDLRFVRGDGAIRRLRSWGEVVHEGSAGPRMWGCVQDVTAIRETAEAWHDSEQRFRMAFEHAPIGMAMTSMVPNSAGRFLRVNRAFAEMLGYTVEEMQALTFRDVTHPDDLGVSDTGFHDLMSGAVETWSTAKRYLHRDGTSLQALVSSSLVRDPAGRPQYVVTQVVDVTERLQAQADLERLALTDSLTGLANRALFNDRLRHALDRLERDGGHLAVLLLDLDRFKLVNDTLGHQVGDNLLVEVARRLRAVTRADTTVSRLGGDEFVVLVEGLSHPGDVHGVAQRILGALAEPYPVAYPAGLQATGAEAVVRTASIGIAVASHEAKPAEELLREADLALYRAKDAGRNRYALFDDDLRAQAVGRLDAERRLRRAVDTSALTARLQPVVDLRTGRIVGAEMLVRLDDPELGLRPPTSWVEVAEDTGLIADIDGWVVQHCAELAARWADPSGTPVGDLALNVSSYSLEQPRFVATLREALEEHGISGRRLRIELTERTLLAGTPATLESLAHIGALDVQLGLDDFGTGYSSLAYLQRFALDFLKIDRSFVAQLGRSQRAAAIVGAIIDLAHALGLSVAAEGVERDDQLRLLRALGCERAQGYLFGGPMPAEELEELVRARPRW